MVSTFNNFELEIKIVCLDRNNENISSFCAGEYFNLEGDFVGDDCKLWKNCEGYNLHMFVDLKIIQRKNNMMGSCLSKKIRIKIIDKI